MSLPDMTEAAIKSINGAIMLATEHGHASCEPAHLASCIFGEGIGVRVCERAGVDHAEVQKAIRRLLLK